MSAIYHNLTNWKRSGCPFIDCDPGERERESVPRDWRQEQQEMESEIVSEMTEGETDSPHTSQLVLLHFTTHKLTAFCLNETSHHFASSCSRQLGDVYCRILLMSSSL